MSSEVAVLGALLKRAEPHVIVQGQNGQLPIDEARAFVGLATMRRQRFVSEPIRAFEFNRFDVSEPAVKSEIAAFLRQALGPYVRDDRIRSAGNFVSAMRGDGFHLDDFVRKALELSAVWGPERAARMVIESRDEPASKGLWICLIDGIRMNESIEVCDGVRLEPLSASVAEMPPYMHEFVFSRMPGAEGLAAVARSQNAALLVHDIVISPKFMNAATGPQTFADPDPFRISGATSEVQDFDRVDFVNVLSLASNPGIAQVAQWWYVFDDDIANVGRGANTGGLSYNQRQVQDSTPAAVVDSGFSEAVQVYSDLAALPAERRERIDIPLHRLIGVSGRRSLADKIVDLGIALESLYLDDGNNSELSYRLALRAAKHLGTDTSSRLQIFEELRDFYGKLRSKAVHSGKVRPTVKMNGKQIDSHDAVARVQDLCSQAVRRVISEGYPDWDQVLLSD